MNVLVMGVHGIKLYVRNLISFLLSSQCWQNSLTDLKDVGILQVKVLKAVDLLAADFSGTEQFHV